MRLTPKEPDIPDIGGFTATNDIFEYRDFGERLGNLFLNIDEPLVFMLDGEWGSGKSVFARQWAGLMRERGAPVIHFDAFGNDHHDEAFLPLSAEIYSYAQSRLGPEQEGAERFFDNAKKVGRVLAPLAAKIAIRAGTAGMLSLDDIKAGGAAAQAAIDESSNAFESIVSDQLKSAGEERAALEDFRNTLSGLAEKLSAERDEGEQAYPIIFLIDELDRCRPPFALSLIERIKHLFSVPGVCFLLVGHFLSTAE